MYVYIDTCIYIYILMYIYIYVHIHDIVQYGKTRYDALRQDNMPSTAGTAREAAAKSLPYACIYIYIYIYTGKVRAYNRDMAPELLLFLTSGQACIWYIYLLNLCICHFGIFELLRPRKYVFLIENDQF